MRPERKFVYDGRELTVYELAVIAKVSHSAMYSRLLRYPPEVAVRMAPKSQRKYLWEGRELTAPEVAEAAGVPVKSLLYRLSIGKEIHQAVEEIRLAKRTARQCHDRMMMMIVTAGGDGVSCDEIKRVLNIDYYVPSLLNAEDLVYEDVVDGHLTLFAMPELLRRYR